MWRATPLNEILQKIKNVGLKP
uniref:Uncharacterized protein n=1 Tax=Rhizophora mucronata TaxID=61149 RepID=A0A2P2QW65_RHIMU